MRAELHKRLQDLDVKLDELIEHASKYSEEAINKAPAPGKWSATQIMNHLILSEKLSLAYCKKKLSFSPDLKKAGVAAKLRSLFVKYYLLSPLKFKAPKGIQTKDLPDHDTLFSIAQKWKEVRKEISSFIDEVPDVYLDKEVYKHPFGGRLSLLGLFEFFNAHFKNHYRQILAALKT